MAVSKRLRYEVMRRDNHSCRYCGQTSPEVKLTVDHVQPIALGGQDEPSNLVTACFDCNIGKSSAPIDSETVEQVSADAVRWAAAMKEAALEMLSERSESEDYIQAFVQAWGGTDDRGSFIVPAPRDWRPTLHGFYSRGLPVELMTEAAQIAMSTPSVSDSNVFRYFCGVCYRMLDKMADRAQQIVEADDGEG